MRKKEKASCFRGSWKVFVARSWAGSESDAIPSFSLFFFFFPFFSLLFLGLRRGLGAIVVAMELHLTITAWV